jgi:ATP-dependent Clp endopeptidase proteolytic subunit ClpP
MALTHNSKLADSEPEWSAVDKTKLPRNAFADQGEADQKSSWGYPHHWVENGGDLNDMGVFTSGDMYLHRGGLDAAWSAANGGRTGQKASQEVIDHLQAHRQALGLTEGKKMLNKKTWYSIKAQNGGEIEIDIFDEIGFWGVTAKDFITDLKKYPDAKSITLRLNSYGGEVFDGVAIYNALKRHPANLTVVVYGVAASIASVIAMAGDRVVMPENTYLFVHDPLALVIGDAADMRDMADALDKIAAGLISSYVAKTGQDASQIRKWMNEDTWFTAAEALAAGLADEVTSAVKIAANATLSRFKNLPAPLDSLLMVEEENDPDKEEIKDSEEMGTVPAPSAREAGPSPHEIRAQAEKSAKEIVSLCAKAGIADAAASFLDSGLGVDDVRAKLADADKIRARCAAAKLSERANGYIKAGMSVGEVANDLFDVLIARQGPEIDNKLGPDQRAQSTVGRETVPFDPRAINKRYREREEKFHGRKS